MPTEIIALLLSLSHLLLVAVSAGHAILYKRDSRSALGWAVVCITLPIIGALAYYMFGINRVRTRAKAYRRGHMVGFERAQRREPANYCPHPATGLGTVGAAISGNRLTTGNEVVALYDGHETYAAMLAAINAAQRTVRLATYIFESDKTGREFVAALAAAVQRGVSVKVLIDGVGQYYSHPSAAKLLRRAKVDTGLYLPPRLLPPSLHINLRNHRKILVTDGATAYSGGMNIGGRHVRRADGTLAVSDVHFCLTGPVAAELDEAFCLDWFFATGETLAPVETMQSRAGQANCRLIVDGPDENMDQLAMAIVGVISAAHKRVDIMTPYFLPARELISALQSAQNRGVRVRIVLPAKNNLPFVHWATRNMLWELLLWDVEVYYQPPPFCHSKLLVIDDDYALIGSANLDPRSLRLNFELGVEIFDSVFAAGLVRHFDATCASARRVTLDEVDNRPLWQRLRDSVFWLFSPYL